MENINEIIVSLKLSNIFDQLSTRFLEKRNYINILKELFIKVFYEWEYPIEPSNKNRSIIYKFLEEKFGSIKTIDDYMLNIFEKPRIIFRKLSLFNFGPYLDSHELEFSFNDKKLTIIRGDIGAGKTVILQAIYWVLFPLEENDREREMIFLRQSNPLFSVNIKAIQNASINDIIDISAELQLDFINENGEISEFRIRRIQSYKKSGEMSDITDDISNNIEYIPNSNKLNVKKNNKILNDSISFYSIINNIFTNDKKRMALVLGEGMLRLMLHSGISIENNLLSSSVFPKLDALVNYLEFAREYFVKKNNFNHYIEELLYLSRELRFLFKNTLFCVFEEILSEVINTNLKGSNAPKLVVKINFSSNRIEIFDSSGLNLTNRGIFHTNMLGYSVLISFLLISNIKYPLVMDGHLVNLNKVVRSNISNILDLIPEDQIIFLMKNMLLEVYNNSNENDISILPQLRDYIGRQYILETSNFTESHINDVQ